MVQKEKENYGHRNTMPECMHLKISSMKSILKFHTDIANFKTHYCTLTLEIVSNIQVIMSNPVIKIFTFIGNFYLQDQRH